MGRKILGIALIAFMITAFSVPRVSALPAPDAMSVLILDTTVGGPASSGLCPGSQEYSVALAQGLTPVCVDASTWGATPTAEFATYKALVLGDQTCTALPAVAPAEANR